MLAQAYARRAAAEVARVALRTRVMGYGRRIYEERIISSTTLDILNDKNKVADEEEIEEEEEEEEDDNDEDDDENNNEDDDENNNRC